MRLLAQRTALLFLALATASAQNSEQRTARHLDAIRKSPSLLLAFLEAMPKGGDLHNHLSGSIYAENWVDYAVRDNLCVDRHSSTLFSAPCDASCDKGSPKPAAKCAYGDQALYNQLIDAWSMRNFVAGAESGHDHFFATFGKFSLATKNSLGDQLAEMAKRASDDRLQYLELMITADDSGAADLGFKLGWDNDFQKMRERLLEGGLKDVVATTRAHVDQEEARQHKILQCDTPQASPACQVTVRYLYQVLRGLPREAVFAQIVLGFELVQADPRFVGLNLVMPEDWYVPMHDFDLHMSMLEALHANYPKVHISLHAGELAMGLVQPAGLRSHIRQSIERGHAQRIGHGVSVMQENDAESLLREMAARKVLVEICLTSNAVILGIEGSNHPLTTYLKFGVPVALASDDEGVSRSDMTHEYLRAVETYGFSYPELKRMARQSLEHSFLPGQSLWRGSFQPATACSADLPKVGKGSNACQNFLDSSEKARQQWELEKRFAAFEKKY